MSIANSQARVTCRRMNYILSIVQQNSPPGWMTGDGSRAIHAVEWNICKDDDAEPTNH
jgi:hypothetical protein